MVWQRNEGLEQDEIIQNRFTAYLLSAVQRRKAQYIDTQLKTQHIAMLIEETLADDVFDFEKEIVRVLEAFEDFLQSNFFSEQDEQVHYKFFAYTDLENKCIIKSFDFFYEVIKNVHGFETGMLKIHEQYVKENEFKRKIYTDLGTTVIYLYRDDKDMLDAKLDYYLRNIERN